jgi:hypothetical protein
MRDWSHRKSYLGAKGNRSPGIRGSQSANELLLTGLGCRTYSARNDTTRAGVRNNPTQAKRRLEWATQSSVASAKSPVSFFPQLAAGK